MNLGDNLEGDAQGEGSRGASYATREGFIEPVLS